MKADEIRRDTRPWEFWLKECAYQLALANERGTAELEAPMTCRSCNASTRDFKPYPCCGQCGAMLLRDAVSEPDASAGECAGADVECKERQRQIAEVEEEVALLEVALLEFEATLWPDFYMKQAAYSRIFAREQAALADLKRGMK